MAIYNTSTEVEPYVPPVKICWNCLRYGHIAKQCRSKARCKRCGDLPHSDSSLCPRASSPPICLHCDGPHLSGSRECPEFNFQNEFRTYAVNHCLTFAEAKAILRPKKSKKQAKKTHNHPTLSSATNFGTSSYPDLGNTPFSPPVNFSQSSQRAYSEALRSPPPSPSLMNCSNSTPSRFSLNKSRENKNKPSSSNETPDRRKTSPPNPSFASLFNTRMPSSLPNGFALHPPPLQKKDNSPSTFEFQSLSSETNSDFLCPPSSPNHSSNSLSIIENLLLMLTNLINAISSGNPPKAEECHNLINSLSTSLSSLSRSLL